MAAPAHAANQPVTGLGAAVVSTAGEQIASAAVAAEDLRLSGIQRDPSTLGGAARNKLVLSPRPSSYALDDIQRLAPGKLMRMKDGSYLLSQNIAVMPGATLRLSAPSGGLNLRLSSGPGGFVSIVSLGGNLDLVGKKKARFTLSSWDVDANAPDTTPEDGRAYVRTIDGRFTADYLDASALGFWSGRTGGLALTGTALPKPAPLERIDRTGRDALRHFIMVDAGLKPAGPLQPGQKGPNPTPSRLSVESPTTSPTPRSPGMPSGCSSPERTASRSATPRSRRV